MIGQTRYQQLHSVLGNREYVAQIQARTRRDLIGACVLMLSVCAGLGIINSLFRNKQQTPRTVSQSAVPTALSKIATCDVAKCNCITKGTFRRSSALYVEVTGGDATPISGVLRDPSSKSYPLSFLPLGASPKGATCFTARYPLNHSSKPGSYAVQITMKTNNQSEIVLSRGFIVTR
jgi:hypothetical protein